MACIAVFLFNHKVTPQLVKKTQVTIQVTDD